jgi:hypothetical protein
VSFLYNIHNKEFADARLIYFYNGTSNLKKKYKKIEIGNKSHIPSNTSNWMYVIDNHWVIYVPEPLFFNKRKNNYSINRSI